MTKSKNNPKLSAVKIRTCITLAPETHEKAGEIGLNLSYFTERALNWLYSHIESGDINLLEGKTVILNPDLENNLKNEWSRRDSDPCSPACKAVRNLGSDLENKPDSADSENFSTHARRGDLRGDPYMSIGEFMQDKREKFLTFCLNTKPATTDKGTREGYYNKLVGMTDIYTPEDVAKLGTTTKTVLRALSKFHAFVETKYYQEGFNGFSRAQWKGNQKEARYAEGSRAGTKTKDLSPEEVRAGYDRLPDEDARFVYLLTACSGARASHLYKWLSSKDRKIEKLHNGIIRADVRALSSGTKEEVYFYFPAELLKEISEFKPKHKLNWYEHTIQRAGTADRKINLASLRKWNFNLLLDDVPEITANAIQGRAARGIDAKHYFDAAGAGAKHYPKTAKRLREIFSL